MTPRRQSTALAETLTHSLGAVLAPHGASARCSCQLSFLERAKELAGYCLSATTLNAIFNRSCTSSAPSPMLKGFMPKSVC
jgi:hypothetical protein